MSVFHDRDSDDEDVLRQQFCDWLIANGAKYPKIKWPSTETESGSRGAIAIEPIATNEHMVEIPSHLMMSPPNAFADPDVGKELAESENMLYGDLLITVFIMHGLRQGKKSFYSPFLNILPIPGNLCEWSEAEINELQDKRLAIRANNRKYNIKTMYSRCITPLSKRYPDKFPLEEFTFERFKFSWNSVQARAFGRRLPWTAMVPFADCLNHTNVQTKYDFDVNKNGLFRLFPTGSNHYAKGAEVFNSYGRRHNENLLMDYGFAILDNEWDEVDLCLSVPDEDSNYQLRYHALSLVGYQPNRVFRIVKSELSFQALLFLRIVMMDAKELQYYVDTLERPKSPVIQTETENTGTETEKKVRIVEPQDHSQVPQRRDGIDLFGRVFSAELELKALTTLHGLLLTVLGDHATSITQDQQILSALEALRRSDGSTIVQTTGEVGVDAADGNSNKVLPEGLIADSDAYWRLLNAATYRLTRKNILVASLRRLDQIIAYFKALQLRLDSNGVPTTPTTVVVATAEAHNQEQPTPSQVQTQSPSTSASASADSLSDLWDGCVDDLVEDVREAGRDGAGRPVGYDYIRKCRTYRAEATHPLHWPELVIN